MEHGFLTAPRGLKDRQATILWFPQVVGSKINWSTPSQYWFGSAKVPASTNTTGAIDGEATANQSPCSRPDHPLVHGEPWTRLPI